ncbi:hypothetical protein QYM36_010595 [Artemia franciscana]|uniref:Reverse transcriptase domain-containing protein n=1 Tax=Artemia franciscana TaxID=6661 RepID=A0AA88I0X6_ARTSF|nr:hypothetical protein QYM36_010595 [Artemia franciscana]
MSKVKSSLETSDHESLESLTVMNEKSVAVLLDMLKDVIGSFKVPGGKFNASQICSRIQYLHQRTIEENIELLRIENSRLNEVVNLQKELERIKSQKNGQIYVPAPQQASYAQALKGPETFSVILEPVSVEKRNRMNFDEAMQVTESISRVVKGENSDFSVKKVVPAKEGRVILELGSKRELEAAMSVLTEKVSDTKYKPKEVKKHFPRMLVNGAPSPQVKDESEKYLLQCNPEIQRMANEGESFRIITILENASKRKVVVELIRNETENISSENQDKMEPITMEILQDVIKSIKPMKAPGPDGIMNFTIKKNINVLSPTLLKLFNSCLKTSYFPVLWKQANIIVILKKGKTNDGNPGSYRPISLLSNIGKIFERIIMNRLDKLSLDNCWVSKRQFGFCKGKSTIDAVDNMVSVIEKNKEEKKFTLCLFFDIKGAFDNAWHPGILKKLKDKKCPTQLLRLVKSFLSDRTVSYGKDVSRKLEKSCPQGSILSPFLWLININDLLEMDFGENCTIQAYADDVTVILTVIEKVLQPTDWVNAVVVIEKPDKSLRVCIDPHDLNKAIKRPHHPMPTFNEAILRHAGPKFFTKLDTHHGYWSLVLDEESSQLTTFNTPYGCYKFKRMPFGLISAQDEFQRCMEEAF